jgi:OmpA-OmpF porin, OOP family
MKRILVLCALLAMAACAPLPPPPPPAPVVAPPARVFTVYFRLDRSWVGPAGQGILQQAANVYRAGGVVAVHVTGYTDTSGSPAYNQRLSERRAWHVAHILAKLGVPMNAMTVIGRGENDLAVPTPPGVRDPYNRRVTVVE